MKFSELEINERLKETIFKKGFEDLTDIQEQTIPLALAGKDVLGQAQTGTGKTLAFSIPIIEKIETENKNVQALILVPTRELALQVCKEINALGQDIGVKAITVYGGDSIEKQLRELKKNPQIVVGTPGRCIDLIDKNKLKLKYLKYFALDEVDEMLNMGFIDDVEYISSKMPDHKQTLFFSATIPDKIQRIVNKYLIDPQIIKVKSKSIVADRVTQFYIQSKAKQKKLILKHIIDLNSDDKVIIFTQTKRSADEVTDFLISQNLIVGKIHGDLVQQARTQIIQNFRDNKINYLVATDVVARGIDIDDINLVVNYELPQDIEYYIHRIGRTARGTHKTGSAITLVTPSVYEREFKHYSKKLKVNINKMERPEIDDVIKKLTVITKEKILKQDDVEEKVYINLAKELSDLEDPTILISKLLKQVYPELSKEEHLKIVEKMEEGNSKGEGGRSNRGNNNSNRGKRSRDNSRSRDGRNRDNKKRKDNGYKGKDGFKSKKPSGKFNDNKKSKSYNKNKSSKY